MKAPPAAAPKPAAVKPPPTEIGEISLKKIPEGTPAPAAAQHPFPADVSQGLAPPPPVPQAPPGISIPRSRRRWSSTRPRLPKRRRKRTRPQSRPHPPRRPASSTALASMSIPATQMRPGMIIKHKDELHLVFSVEHRTPGNLRAFIQAKLRNVRTGAMFVERFRSPDPIDRVIVDEVKMEFLYNDGDDYYFMDEQVRADHAEARDAGRCGRVPDAEPAHQRELPRRQGRRHRAAGVVEMTVMETEPGIKSATASSVTKPAKMETGLVVQVPPFINEGEKIRVDTAEGAYMSRA
jgi:elongation factor P